MSRGPREEASRSLAQQAYRAIKERILTSQLRPGQMVAAAELAEGYGMSRTPVHEALKMLCSDGLVEVIPRMGYVISSITLNDVQEIFKLRLDLECLGVDEAVSRVTQRDIEWFAQMERKAADTASLVSRDDPDFTRLSVEAHRDFHMMVVSLSGNGRLVAVVRGLLEESDRILSLGPPVARLDIKWHPEHRKLVDALAARDATAAREAMAAHIRAARDRTLRLLVSELPGDVEIGPR